MKYRNQSESNVITPLINQLRNQSPSNLHPWHKRPQKLVLRPHGHSRRLHLCPSLSPRLLFIPPSLTRHTYTHYSCKIHPSRGSGVHSRMKRPIYRILMKLQSMIEECRQSDVYDPPLPHPLKLENSIRRV